MCSEIKSHFFSPEWGPHTDNAASFYGGHTSEGEAWWLRLFLLRWNRQLRRGLGSSENKSSAGTLSISETDSRQRMGQIGATLKSPGDTSHTPSRSTLMGGSWGDMQVTVALA